MLKSSAFGTLGKPSLQARGQFTSSGPVVRPSAHSVTTRSPRARPHELTAASTRPRWHATRTVCRASVVGALRVGSACFGGGSTPCPFLFFSYWPTCSWRAYRACPTFSVYVWSSVSLRDVLRVAHRSSWAEMGSEQTSPRVCSVRAGAAKPAWSSARSPQKLRRRASLLRRQLLTRRF